MEDKGINGFENTNIRQSAVLPSISEEDREVNDIQDENGNPSNIKETLDNFCQKLTNTRTAIVDLEYVISDYIEEARERHIDQREQVRLIRSLARLEETVKEYKSNFDLMGSQIYWLHTALWKVAGHFKMSESKMREIYNKTSETVQNFYDQRAAQEYNDRHGLSEQMTYSNQSDYMSSSSSSSDNEPYMG